jgi:very-short-patch-repair endonuclease
VKVHNLTKLIDRRKELRKRQTLQKEKLWWYLKDRRLLGFKFRRQSSVGGYILDFYCAEKRLIIEIDGEIHDNREHQEYDKLRDKYFKELDYKVLRFANRQVDRDVNGVIKEIENNLKPSSGLQ